MHTTWNLCHLSFQLSLPSPLCNGATLSRPRRLNIAGLNVEKDFGEIMNSTDSLSIGGNVQEGAQQDTPRKVDTFMQGSENQESPGGGSAHSSISPPISLMHDITTATTTTATNQQTTTVPVTLSQLCTPAATPIGGHQILVDPTTGQHFLVSSAPPPPQPQIIYQPVYYSATPAQPVYYHAFASGAHGAYVVAATPITGTQSGTQVTPPHITLGQRFSSTPPPPPSVAQSTVGGFARSVADFDDARSVVTTDNVFEHPLVSATPRSMSRTMDVKQILISKNSTSPPPQTSPVFGKSCSVFDNATAPTPLSTQQRIPIQTCPQDAITTYQQAVSKTIVPTDGHVQPEEGERTPLFGTAPAWWGENGASKQQVQSDTENASAAATAEGANRRPLKSIRMDIDLNEPFVDEEAKKEEKTKAAPRTSAGTAFTVPFDSEESSPKANLSLQDAAKKTSSRRFMRRSAPAAGMISKGTAAKIAGLTAVSSDPKQYLLNKMLMGVGEESGEGPDMMASCEGEEGKPDVDDTLSEAGTYVVEDSDRLNQVVASHTIKDSDAESVSSESTTTQSSDNVRPPASSVRIGSVLPQINENVISTEGGGTEKNELLRELLRMSSGQVTQRRVLARRQVVAPSTPPLSNSARLTAAAGTRARVVTRRPETAAGTEERQYGSHRFCTLASSSSPSVSPRTALTPKVNRAQPHAGASGTNDGAFRRGDGGRFSMRFAGGATTKGGHPTSTAIGRNDRPAFRVGCSGRTQTSSGTGAHKESAEMTAWLRRKDYNPMKAAAEAKKLQQLKARADKFVSNRSISFHQGARPYTSFSPIVRDLNKARHNRSQDDLTNDAAVCGPETILASYSKGISRDLNKLRSVEAVQDEARMNGLENAVQQLTVKCNRSIELIRNSHQGHLSESVENLLEMAIGPVKDCTGTVTDQLDRLSAAFDAIQKYLEVSSASLPASPSGSSPTASVTALSTSPSRRPCSAYQSKLAAAKRSPSGGRKNS